MKTKLLAILLLAGSGSLFAGVRIGIGIGVPAYGYAYGPGYGYVAPPPPPVVAYAPPVYARPGYVFVNGYWYPSGRRYAWRAGYWARPPYVGARWFAPRYRGGRYYRGYWRR